MNILQEDKSNILKYYISKPCQEYYIMTNLGLDQESKVGITLENQSVYFTTVRKL